MKVNGGGWIASCSQTSPKPGREIMPQVNVIRHVHHSPIRDGKSGDIKLQRVVFNGHVLGN